jgi:DNA helicase IV
VKTRPSPSIWSDDEVDFIIENQVDDIALMHGICHVSRGKKEGDFSTMILPKKSASIKVKASHIMARSIKCCLVYELIDQRNESKSIMEYHQAFIAVRVFARPLIKKYKASAVIFMARKDQFTGSEDDMKRLKKGILREHLVNNTHSFKCDIKGQTLRLKASFHPGRRASIEVILEETTGRVNNSPVLY